jgi:hypothetical protein
VKRGVAADPGQDWCNRNNFHRCQNLRDDFSLRIEAELDAAPVFDTVPERPDGNAFINERTRQRTRE